MRLQDWFAQQRHQQPTDMQKMRIYHQFLDKSQRSLAYDKVAYYTKVTVFSLGLVAIGVTAFLGPTNFLFDEGGEREGAILVQDDRLDQVKAETVGTIIQIAKGVLTIIDTEKGKKYELQGNDIPEGKTLSLPEGAEMKFAIEGYTAVIHGPSTFEIERIGDNYVLNLIEGRYVNILQADVPLQVEEDASEDSEVSRPNLIVQSETFSVEPINLHEPVDLTIQTNKEGKSHITNKGGEVMVKNLVATEDGNQEKTYFALRQQSIAVDSDAITVLNEQQVVELRQNIQKEKLVVRYEIDDTAAGISDLTVQEGKTVAETLQQDLNSKQVISEELLYVLETTLSPSSVQRSLTQIQRYLDEENENAYRIAYNNLFSKLDRAAGSFQVAQRAADTDRLGSLAVYAQSLLAYIPVHYYVTSNSLEGLVLVVDGIGSLQKVSSIQTNKETIQVREALEGQTVDSEEILTIEQQLDALLEE